jgi:hypothetical protein
MVQIYIKKSLFDDNNFLELMIVNYFQNIIIIQPANKFFVNS